MIRTLIALSFTVVVFSATLAEAQDYGYPPRVAPISPVVPVRAEWRQEIRSMDILHRPSRVGHFYGNTVRRRHHR